MELKVWVEGVVRVVCGLSMTTSCQDVVIALAQAIGRTGRYILILKLRGTERQLVAHDCPLQQLSQLGQLASEVHFVLQRTGPSLTDAQDPPPRDRCLPLPSGPPGPEPLKRSEPHKALTFNLGPSTHPKRTKRTWSPSPRASPEPRASPVSFLNPVNPVGLSDSKDEVFRKILQQQRKLQDLEVQLRDLERETDVWEERKTSSGPSLSPVSEEELEDLERRLRQNEADLKNRVLWEDQLQTEMDRERDLHRRLHQIHSSLDDHSDRIQDLQVWSAHLEKHVQLAALRRSSRPREEEEEEEEEQVEQVEQVEALRPLKQELHQRLQQGEQLDANLSETQRNLRSAEKQLQGRWQTVEELNKELRQCKLQHFIQQTTHTQHTHLPDVYLSSAGIVD